jgi:hypothetical protein
VPKKVFCSFQIFRPNGKAIRYMRAKPERGVFAVPFIRMDHPLAPSSSLVELVRLPKTGAILLTGDSVHTKANWDGHEVPSRNFNVQQSLASLDRLAAVLKENNAQLWIGRD